MSVARQVCQSQNVMGMIRHVIRVLESVGENVDSEKAEFFSLFGFPYDRRTKVRVNKVRNRKIRSLKRLRQCESDGTVPSGLEAHLRNVETWLKVETQKRVREHPDWTLSAEEERLIDNAVTLCTKYNIDLDFYRAEFVDPLYEVEELL